MILLDTHVLVWMMNGDRRLGVGAREGLASASGRLHLSAVTFWELGMLLSKDRIALTMPLPDLAISVVRHQGMTVMPVSAAIAIDAHTFPRLHGDPMDRLIIVTARALGCPLMTGDHVIVAYAATGHVEVIDAGR